MVTGSTCPRGTKAVVPREPSVSISLPLATKPSRFSGKTVVPSPSPVILQAQAREEAADDSCFPSLYMFAVRKWRRRRNLGVAHEKHRFRRHAHRETALAHDA